MQEITPDIAPPVEIPSKTTVPVEFKAATFDQTVPATMGDMKKMQDPARYEKARFRFRLYPLRKGH